MEEINKMNPPSDRVKKVFYKFMKANNGTNITTVVLFCLLVVAEILGITGGGITGGEMSRTTLASMIMSIVVGVITIILLCVWASMTIVCIVFVNRQKYMDVIQARGTLIRSLVLGLVFGIIGVILGMVSYIHIGIGIPALIFSVTMIISMLLSFTQTSKIINLVEHHVNN